VQFLGWLLIFRKNLLPPSSFLSTLKMEAAVSFHTPATTNNNILSHGSEYYYLNLNRLKNWKSHISVELLYFTLEHKSHGSVFYLNVSEFL
jgi:hypothetical protein